MLHGYVFVGHFVIYLAKMSLLFDSKELYLIRLNSSSAHVQRMCGGCPLHVCGGQVEDVRRTSSAYVRRTGGGHAEDILRMRTEDSSA